MTDAHSHASTRNTKSMKAMPEALYQAFTDPIALAVWLVPGDMTDEIHSFECRVGGGYQMSLYYPFSEQTFRAKTEDREDRCTARFMELTPARRIVEAITFDSVDLAFLGEMIMVVTFKTEEGGTTVSIISNDIPQTFDPRTIRLARSRHSRS